MASVRIGSAFGIPIKLGVSFLLVLPLVAYLIGSQVAPTVTALNQTLEAGIDPTLLTEGVFPWILGAVAAVGLFASVVLHEFGHSLVAMHYELEIESITLWFLGGIDRFVEFPDDWRHELAIAIAGPAVSLGLGALFYGAFVALPVDLPSARFVAGYLAVLNVVLAAFNLLPWFPMDGGRVLRALLARKRSRLRATQIASEVGKGFAVLLGLAGILLFNLFWVAIAFFIYIGATGEARQAMMEAAFEGITVGDIMTPAGELDTVTPATTLDTLIERMLLERHTGYPVIHNGDLVSIVTLEDVQEIDPDRRASITIDQVMSKDLMTVLPETDASEAITDMQRDGVGRLLVTDTSGDLVGLISRTDLMTVFQIVRDSRSTTAVAEYTVGR